ncbi:MAG: hypothetical protein NVS2B16_27300 [Chloroflexota bacterium]
MANQNEGLSIPGELDEYNHIEGDFLRALVSSTAPHAPFYPDGIILYPDGHTLFVADFLGGVVDLFDVRSGTFLRRLDFSQAMSASNYPTAGEFYLRGLVFGPNGLLYVSIRSLASGVPGGILSYNLATGASAVVVSSSSATGGGLGVDLRADKFWDPGPRSVSCVIKDVLARKDPAHLTSVLVRHTSSVPAMTVLEVEFG